MAITVNTNVASLNAQRNLNATNGSLATSLQRLSSGLRVNSAKDDASGLAVAETLSSLVRGSAVAVRNANDGISMAQTAEGGLSTVASNLQRIREIAVQASNGSINDDQRGNLQKEVDQLTAEIARTVAATSFNGIELLNSSSSITFQIGANEGDTVDIALEDLTALAAYEATGAAGTVDVSTAAAAQSAIADMDTDIQTVTGARATFGAVQNRFDAIISGLQVYSENLDAARARIMDADFAVETSNLTRAQILQQAGTAILAQANSLPQNALTLLR